MFTVLMILHFLGLVMGMGGGFANIVAKRQMPKAQPATYPGMALAAEAVGKMAASGLVLLWLTGIAMTMIKYAGAVPTLLWLKIGIVGVMTVLVVGLNLMMIGAKRSGTTPDGQKVDRYAYSINSLGILTVIVAVVLFR